MDTAADISQVTDAARTAARALANATTQAKNRGLEAIATALMERSDQILAANAEDVARGRAEQMSEGLLDRLALPPDRIRGIVEAVREGFEDAGGNRFCVMTTRLIPRAPQDLSVIADGYCSCSGGINSQFGHKSILFHART